MAARRAKAIPINGQPTPEQIQNAPELEDIFNGQQPVQAGVQKTFFQNLQEGAGDTVRSVMHNTALFPFEKEQTYDHATADIPKAIGQVAAPAGYALGGGLVGAGLGELIFPPGGGIPGAAIGTSVGTALGLGGYEATRKYDELADKGVQPTFGNVAPAAIPGLVQGAIPGGFGANTLLRVGTGLGAGYLRELAGRALQPESPDNPAWNDDSHKFWMPGAGTALEGALPIGGAVLNNSLKGVMGQIPEIAERIPFLQKLMQGQATQEGAAIRGPNAPMNAPQTEAMPGYTSRVQVDPLHPENLNLPAMVEPPQPQYINVPESPFPPGFEQLPPHEQERLFNAYLQQQAHGAPELPQLSGSVAQNQVPEIVAPTQAGDAAYLDYGGVPGQAPTLPEMSSWSEMGGSQPGAQGKHWR